MLTQAQDLIQRETVAGTGAAIGLEPFKSGDTAQTGLRLWFDDLGKGHSPVVELRPYGMKRYRCTLSFGRFAMDTIHQMQQADEEERQLARAIISTIDGLTIAPEQSPEDWVITGPEFEMQADKRIEAGRFEEDALKETCRDLVIPILAAMAELYGYDPIEERLPEDEHLLMEGEVKLSVIRRRERNPRNRLLCLRVHGHQCKVCGVKPSELYGDAGDIIEVHHLQPLSSSDGVRTYNPATDLIPVCPNCHRAAHTRRPAPWSPDELREKLS